jgi:hypothetical protein
VKSVLHLTVASDKGSPLGDTIVESSTCLPAVPAVPAKPGTAASFSSALAELILASAPPALEQRMHQQKSSSVAIMSKVLEPRAEKQSARSTGNYTRSLCRQRKGDADKLAVLHVATCASNMETSLSELNILFRLLKKASFGRLKHNNQQGKKGQNVEHIFQRGDMCKRESPPILQNTKIDCVLQL